MLADACWLPSFRCQVSTRVFHTWSHSQACNFVKHNSVCTFLAVFVALLPTQKPPVCTRLAPAEISDPSVATVFINLPGNYDKQGRRDGFEVFRMNWKRQPTSVLPPVTITLDSTRKICWQFIVRRTRFKNLQSRAFLPIVLVKGFNSIFNLLFVCLPWGLPVAHAFYL